MATTVRKKVEVIEGTPAVVRLETRPPAEPVRAQTLFAGVVRIIRVNQQWIKGESDLPWLIYERDGDQVEHLVYKCYHFRIQGQSFGLTSAGSCQSEDEPQKKLHAWIETDARIEIG